LTRTTTTTATTYVDNEPNALEWLSSTLSRALPLDSELQNALKEGVRFEYKGGGELGVIIGEKQDSNDMTSSKETQRRSVRELALGITALSVSVVVAHSFGSLEESVMTLQFKLLRYILAWAQMEWSETLEVVRVDVPERFVLPKDYLKTQEANITPGMGPFPHKNRNWSALTTLSWTGDIQFLPEVLQCFDPQAVRGIEKLEVRSEISVDDVLIILGRFEGLGLGAGLREVEIGGAGVGGCEPVLLPEYMESDSNSVAGGQVAESDSSVRVTMDGSIAPPPSKKLSFPKLDTLRITASTSLAAFFAAADLPRLCKLELDLGDEADEEEADKTMCALLGSVLIPSSLGLGAGEGGAKGSGLLYLDVRHGGTFEIGERIEGVVLQRDPGAYVSINGWK